MIIKSSSNTDKPPNLNFSDNSTWSVLYSVTRKAVQYHDGPIDIIVRSKFSSGNWYLCLYCSGMFYNVEIAQSVSQCRACPTTGSIDEWRRNIW